mmetsp:Transcript_57607/g.122509  ORF Transcript_57607/g.122509 Transcript_57607/m.122509 type:complete len:324 (-) Transcript_57607:73-1044(-)
MILQFLAGHEADRPHTLCCHRRRARGNAATSSQEKHQLLGRIVLEQVALHRSSFLDLDSIGKLAATEVRLCERVWSCIGFWRERAREESLPALSFDPSSCDATQARDTFRRAFFGMDGSFLRSFGKNHRGLLEAAAKLLQRTLERDTIEHLEASLALAEHALNGMDPADASNIQAAEAFLAAAKQCISIIGEGRYDLLDYAFRTSLNLHDLMTTSIHSRLSNTLSDLQESFWLQAEDSMRRLEEESANDDDSSHDFPAYDDDEENYDSESSGEEEEEEENLSDDRGEVSFPEGIVTSSIELPKAGEEQQQQHCERREELWQQC